MSRDTLPLRWEEVEADTVGVPWRCIMGDQHSALRVKLSDLIEGMDFQSDECFSYLNTTTGKVVSVTTEELRAAEEDEPLEDFPK